MTSQGTLFIVAAPSGAGKTSLMAAVTEAMDNIEVSVSSTTRPKRPGETDGMHYHFLSQDEFKAAVSRHEFLEHAEVFGNYYGTSALVVQQALNQGIDLVLEIDWQGAQQVRQRLQDTVSIFILPPSRATLQQRLEQRGQDDAATIARRMAAAINEISHYSEFDYLVVNDDFATAKQEIISIIQARRLRLEPQTQRYQQLIDDLL